MAPAAEAPVWPANPRSLAYAKAGFSQSTADDDVDTGVLIAVGAAIVAAAGIGMAGPKRLRAVFRPRMA